MLELIGFVANRDLGLQYFRGVYDNGGLRGALLFCFMLITDVHCIAPMTAMFLSLNYLMIPRGLTRLEDSCVNTTSRALCLSLCPVVAAAEPIITQQVQKYPNGGFYLWIDSLLQLKKGGMSS